ncbi:MAG TPA: carboxypeptidase regulatory-like domain-containing protein [Thermoanaerobaculia bacterium]|nr:carboxypeptidase regulatory-like domain-containing protein [Thermoanaerobaculia bacterium]
MRHAVRSAIPILAFLVALPSFAAITGTVMNADGAAVGGAKISVFAPETLEARRARLVSATPQRKALGTATTDAHGSFRVDVPKEQSFVDLRVDAAGYAPESQWSAASDEAGAIVLVHAPAKTGTITAGGKPLANATVDWIGITGVESQATTDASGKYSVPDPAKWAIRIIIIHPDTGIFIETMLRDVTKLTPTRAIPAGLTVTGRVVGEDGTTPAAGAELFLDHWPAGKTADDGTFTIAHAEKHWLDLEARLGARVAHRAHAETAVTLKLGKGATLAGTLLDAKTKQPVAGATIALMPPGFGFGGETLNNTITDAKGNYAFANIVPGNFAVDVIRPGYHAARAEVGLVAGRTVQKPLYGTPLGTIAGTVVDEDKRPVAAAHLSTRAASREPMNLMAMGRMQQAHGAYSGPDGRFVLREVTSENDVFVDAAKKGFPPAHTSAMRVAAGEKKGGVTLTIPRGLAFSGRVLDKNNRPVSGAAVEMNESNPDPMSGMRRIMASVMNRPNDDAVRSASDGTFTVRVKEGRYDVVVKAEGYAAKTLRAQTVAAGMKPVDVVLDPGVEITGRVSRGGAGVDGVTVATMSMTEGMTSTTTGPDGSFRLADLTPGAIMLIFSRPDSFIQEMRSVTAPARDVTIELPPGGRISGHVVDKATHSPVTSFQAGVSTSRGGGGMVIQTPPMLKSFTSDDGSFTLENVKPGPTQVVVNAPGYTQGKAPNIEIEDGKSAPEITVELDTGVKLVGKVTGPDGSPLAGVTVAPDMTSRGGRVMRFDAMGISAATDPNGEYTIEALEPGEKTFNYSHSGYVTETRTVNLTGTQVRTDVQLSSGMRIAGVVVTEAGTPVADASVRASSASDATFGREAHSDGNGNFLFEGLAPGHYTFNAAKNGYANAIARDVDVSTGAPVRLVVKSGGTISGHVSGLTAEELQQTNVTASGVGVGTATAPVDAGGNYRIDGAPTGSVRVAARVGGPMFAGSTKSSEPKTVVLDPGGSATADIEFKSDTVVRGRVTRAGQPERSATVMFFPKGGKAQTNATTQTDGTGYYELSGLADGPYSVQVIDFNRLAPYWTSYNVSGSGTFDVEIRTANVRGRVLDATNDQPLNQARVEIRPVGSDTPINTQATTTDASGNFSLPAVPLGSYQVSADMEGYGHTLKDLQVQDAPPDVELKLSPSAGIVLNVVDGRDGRLLAAQPRVVDMQGRAIDTGFRFTNTPEPLKIDVSPGTYRVTLYAANYAAKTITVPAPSSQNVAMTPGGTLLIKSKSSASNLRVRLIDGNGLPYGRMGFSEGTYPLLASPAMTTLPNVAPGVYRLDVLDTTDRVVNSTSVTISDGVPTTVEI